MQAIDFYFILFSFGVLDHQIEFGLAKTYWCEQQIDTFF